MSQFRIEFNVSKSVWSGSGGEDGLEGKWRRSGVGVVGDRVVRSCHELSTIRSRILQEGLGEGLDVWFTGES